MNIELVKILNNAGSKNVLIVGVVHGDEPQGEFIIKDYLASFEKKNAKNNIYFISRLNLSNTRKNLNGVDLNRNFPTKNWELLDKNDDYFGGDKPLSEEETKFIVNLMNEVQFDAIVTIHAPYKIVNYDGPAESLANKIAEILNYKVESDIGYPTPGSFGTYAGVERSIPTVTIELSEETFLEEYYPKFKKIFNYLMCEF